VECCINWNYDAVADLGKRPGSPLIVGKKFLVKKERITERRKAGRASITNPHPTPDLRLSSRYSSATVMCCCYIKSKKGSLIFLKFS